MSQPKKPIPEVDFASVEKRLIGQFFTPEWLDALKVEADSKGQDYYKLMTSKLTGMPYRDVTKSQGIAIKKAVDDMFKGLPGLEKKTKGVAQTDGWLAALRRGAEEARAKETERASGARNAVEAARTLPFEERLAALLLAHDVGILRTSELLDELRVMARPSK